MLLAVQEEIGAERSAKTLGALEATGNTRAGPGIPFTEICRAVKFTEPAPFCSRTPGGTATLICEDET